MKVMMAASTMLQGDVVMEEKVMMMTKGESSMRSWKEEGGNNATRIIIGAEAVSFDNDITVRVTTLPRAGDNDSENDHDNDNDNDHDDENDDDDNDDDNGSFITINSEDSDSDATQRSESFCVNPFFQ